MSGGGTRRSVLPLEHLEAEMLAAPLASRTSFRCSLVSLDRNLQSGTAELWREQESDLLSRFPGMSVDELVIRRDQVWFGGPLGSTGRYRPMLEVLRGVAEDLFCPTGAEHGWSRSQVERRKRWRWITFALPADLLFAATKRTHGVDDRTSPSLRRMLHDRGFAEPHMHLKAAMDFPLLWESLQRAIATSSASEAMLAGPGAEHDEGRDLARWLLRCSLSRLALAGFLANPRWRPNGFADYLRGRVLPGVAALEGRVRAAIFLRALREIGAGEFGTRSPSFPVLRDLYASLSRQSPSRGARRTMAALDPLAWWFPESRDAHPELGFLLAAFEYLDSTKDPAFARLFWQVQRLRVTFYRHVVQRPMTPGLQWFTRTYERLSAPRRALGVATFVEEAARLAGPGLRALEVRVSPNADGSDLKSVLLPVDTASRLLGDTEVGVVFHFVRERGKAHRSGIPKPWGLGGHDDPGSRTSNPTRYRFAGFFLERRAEAAALASLLLTFPRVLERVRGLDLCTDELGVPLWVMLPLINHVRRAGEGAAASLSASAHPVKPLRLTVHAGEDFDHLLGSIRRVGEALEYMGLREGDRIGHGVALGVDVSEWAARATGLAIPRGERLLDLIWAARKAMTTDSAVLRSWLSWLAHEACRVAAEIFPGRHCTLTELNDWISALHSNAGLSWARFPSGPAPGWSSKPERLLLARLRDRGVYQRAQVLERLDVTREVPLVSELQAEVRRQLATSGIVVEINPSSNLLIGHLGDLTSHPSWRLCPPVHNTELHPVRVCVGSDDPITFATCLPDEYQLLADAMVEGGLAMPNVDAWLDSARANGLSARFTVPRSSLPLTRPFRFGRLPIRV